MKTTYTLNKSREGFWILLLKHEDGSINDYRYRTKTEAKNWLKAVGLLERRTAR